MKRKILLITFLVLAALLSVSAISANDVNVTDSYATNLVDDSSDDSVLTSYEIDSSEVSTSNGNPVSNIVDDSSKVSLSSEEVLGSDDSNNLSTNNLGSSLDSDTLSATSTSIVVNNLTTYYTSGDKLKVSLVDANGKGISGQKIIIHIVGKDYTRTTDSNGDAYLPIGLKPGTYSATVSFKGTSQYSAAKDVSVAVEVLSTIKSNDLVKYYNGRAKYEVTIVDGQGAPVAGTVVGITVSGRTYYVKTNASGVGSLAIGLKPGSYKITAEDTTTGLTVTNNIKILSTVTASDLNKVRSDSKRFTATFYTSEGEKLVGTVVQFVFISGKSSKTYYAKTNDEGVASLAIGAAPGTYTMKSVNSADGISCTNNINVYKIVDSKIVTNPYLFIPGDARTVQATLLNQFDYAPGAGRTVTLTVNGKTYTGASDNDGVVSFNLLSSLGTGSYTATYKFAGDEYYKASSATNNIIILSSKKTDLTVKSGTTYGSGASSPFKVALTASGIPLAGRVVYITVAGKTYYRSTDSNGIASLNINLKVGNHDISYGYDGDLKLDGTSGKTTITVKARTSTSLTWKTGTTLNQGSHTHKILLLDSSNKAISGKTVKLTVNKVTYTATTASDGYASFNVNLPAGTYAATYSYEGDNTYAPSQGTTNLVVNKNTAVAGGYWLFGGDMNNVNVATLVSKGTSDIFLNYYAFTQYGTPAVEKWIAFANNKGVRVHIWMQAFYNGNWINPKTASAATINSIINEAKGYAQVPGVSGVHLDYLRYPGNAYQTSGGTAAITSFVQKVSEAVHGVNPNCIVSAAIMPETTSNAYYYGQDMSQISKYLDVVIPMVYKGNYAQSSSWITSTTKWFVDNSNGAQVWTGLQSYKSDDDTTKLSATELSNDCQAAFNGKASGVVLFRWGLSNFVDFTGSSSSSTASKVSMSSIISGAKAVKSYYESNSKLPTSVKLAEGTFTMPQFLYLMSKAIVQLGSSNTNSISPIDSVKDPTSSTPAYIGSQQLVKSDYITLANRVASYIESNKQAPAYASSAVGNVVYEELGDAFSRIITFYSNNDKYMPNYVTITQGSYTPGSYPSTISALAKQLTSGLTSEREKAVALYNWVRDYISYEFYYDTQKGASGTLSSRGGNCCDQAQLLVALARSSGLTARFATGYCTFSSGSSYGHVWVQIKLSGSWHAVDTTSTRNSFDSIVNWNTASYTNRGTYDVLPY